MEEDQSRNVAARVPGDYSRSQATQGLTCPLTRVVCLQPMTSWEKQGCISSRTCAETSRHSELPVTKGGLCVCRAQDARQREMGWNAGNGVTKDTSARQPSSSWSTRNIKSGSALQIPVWIRGSDHASFSTPRGSHSDRFS